MASMMELQNAEFKEAFDEFDKVSRFTIHWLRRGCFSGGRGAKAGVSTLSHLSGVFRGKVILGFWEVSSEIFCRLFGVLFG